jgi:hypothetical protein
VPPALVKGFHEHPKDALPRKALVKASLELRQADEPPGDLVVPDDPP